MSSVAWAVPFVHECQQLSLLQPSDVKTRVEQANVGNIVFKGCACGNAGLQHQQSCCSSTRAPQPLPSLETMTGLMGWRPTHATSSIKAGLVAGCCHRYLPAPSVPVMALACKAFTLCGGCLQYACLLWTWLTSPANSWPLHAKGVPSEGCLQHVSLWTCGH